MRRICLLALILALSLAPATAQSVRELQALPVPRELSLSSDGSLLSFKLGDDHWKIATTANSKPLKSDAAAPAKVEALKVPGAPKATGVLRSPDGTKLAYLDMPRPDAAPMLFCDGKKISDAPIRGFQWSADSTSFWVLVSDGADIAFGRMSMDGHFEHLSSGAALRGFGGLFAANDVVAWVQSDPSHAGAIWVEDKAGKIYQLFDPSPETTKWSEAWTQEVVRWKNAHGEELQGILARPKGLNHVPLLVDPYSGWQNRFLNIGMLGNYAFVKAGFAVFYPDHRAPFAYPAASFGDAYVGASKDRDPVDVLTDDVMSGVDELVRRGYVDRDRMFLYSFSTGASAIDQLLTQTTAFRAAVSFGGVADWLGYYRANQPKGDDTIPNFLGGRRPEDSPALYDRISPIKSAARIKTPLMLVIGDKDSIPGGGSRYEDTLAFHDALVKASASVELVVHQGQGHGLNDVSLTEQHVQKAIAYFRAHLPEPK